MHLDFSANQNNPKPKLIVGPFGESQTPIPSRHFGVCRGCGHYNLPKYIVGMSTCAFFCLAVRTCAGKHTSNISLRF